MQSFRLEDRETCPEKVRDRLEGLHKLDQGKFVGIGKIGPEIVPAILDEVWTFADFQQVWNQFQQFFLG